MMMMMMMVDGSKNYMKDRDLLVDPGWVLVVDVADD